MKKYWFCEKPAILVEAEKAQRKVHPVLLVVFYLLFGAFLIKYLNMVINGSMKMLILANLSNLIPLSLCLFFVKFVERRSWASMGIVKNRTLTTYLILAALVFIIASLLLLHFYVGQEGTWEENPLVALGVLVSVIINNLCHVIVLYGFLLISLPNRMSMKNAILLTVLIPSLIFFIIDIYHIDWTSAINGIELIFKLILKTIVSLIFVAACALLLLRTNHIWGVAILTLFWNLRLDIIPFYYIQIITFIAAAAILCAVLFWPKKLTENQEGAGLVSQ